MKIRIQSKLQDGMPTKARPEIVSGRIFIFGFDMIDFSKPELWGKDTHLALGRLLLETTQTRIN